MTLTRNEYDEDERYEYDCDEDYSPLRPNRVKYTRGSWEVDFFHAFDSVKLAEVRQMEDEEVATFAVSSLPKVVPNLRWIIPMHCRK